MSNDSSKLAKTLQVVQTAFTGLVLYIVPPVLASIVILFGINVAGMTTAEAESWVETPVAQFFYVLLTELLVVGALFWLLRLFRQTWRHIGVLRPKYRDIGYALIGFAVYLVLYFIVASVLHDHLDFEQRQELGFDTTVHGVQLGLVFLSLVVLPPLVEELLFRGYLYTQFKRALPVVWAALAVSVLFALGHLQIGSGNPLLWVAALDTFVLSLVLVYLREKTGAIWAGVGVHAMKNFLAFLILFVFQVS